MMERSAWLAQMRTMTEALYDHFAPLYWTRFGVSVSENHLRFLNKFLRQITPGSRLLSAGCGAGKYDGLLLEAGHTVVGIDLSEGMLSRARERYPQIAYQKMALHELVFQGAFEGVLCIDTLEHVFPEDWPRIVHGFREALVPGGWLYFTLDVSAAGELDEAYERAKTKGLPVVPGEVAAEVAQAYEKVMQMDLENIPADLADRAVYHFYPPVEQVRKWLTQGGFVIESEGAGAWYRHFLVRLVG